jgi:hypothetical protein
VDNRWDNDVQDVEYAPENAARWAGRKVRLLRFAIPCHYLLKTVSHSSLASLLSDGEGKTKGEGCGFYEKGWCFIQLS